MSKPPVEEKKILITDHMVSNTSYLKEELAFITGLSIVDVIIQLKRFKTDGKIELTNTNNYEFWSKKDETKEHKQTATKSL